MSQVWGFYLLFWESAIWEKTLYLLVGRALDNTSLILGDWDKSKQRGDICWGIRMGLGRNGEKGTTLWVWDIHLGRKTV